MNESDDFVEDDFSPEDDFVEDDFAEETPERGLIEKGARIAAQYGLGALEGSVPGLVYDIGVAPASSTSFYTFNELQRMGEDIEFLAEKNLGKPVAEWPENDRALYEDLAEKIKNPQQISENAPNLPDLSIRGLAEQATGIDLHPEGFEEKAAQWAGFIRDPKKIFELGKTGLSPKSLFKAIFPSGQEAARGIGAGIALQMAETGAFGPIGTLASAIVGDIAGNVAGGAGKAVVKLLTNPREALAEVAAKFTKKDKLNLQQQIIKDFRDSGVQADIGTITDSDLMKFIQSRLAQSGLTGDALDELSKNIRNQVKEEYKAVADSLGQARFATANEAGETAKNTLKQIRDADLAEVRNLYEGADSALKKDAFVNPSKALDKVKEIEEALKPGQIKSAEQNAVLEVVQKLKRDMTDSSGQMVYSKVKDLMNDKIALGDIIDYEIQGGQKQLLKGLVHELDRVIISHGKDNPAFASKYINAQKRFGQHAKTFRNKRVAQLLKDSDPAQLMNKMNTVQGIKDLDKMLKQTVQGRQLMDNLKRFKLDRMIGDNLEDSVTQQIKHGTFSKLLEKGKNREIIGTLLPQQSLKRLQKLQKNSGHLAEAAQKFLNTSKSGVNLTDVSIVSKVLLDIGSALSGNPWPLLMTAGGLGGARYITKLMGDPAFLQLVEDMILASQTNNFSAMKQIGQLMIPTIRTAMQEDKPT